MKIKVYSTENCPYCVMLKDWLKEKGVEFEEIDVGKNKKAAKEMVEKTGQMGVPVTDIDGHVVVGFNKEAIEELLEKDSEKKDEEEE